MVAGNWKSYSEFSRKTDYMDRYNAYKSSEDCFEDFLENYEKVSNDEYKIIRKYWFKFCNGNPGREEIVLEEGLTIQEMEQELSEYED